MRKASWVLVGLVVLVAGVGCTPTPPPGIVLAIAYTNIDGIDGYDEAGGDVLIAKLVDSNDDGVVSPGDTVFTHRYPLDLEATGFGTFQVMTHEVEVVFWADSNAIGVNDNDGAQYVFQVVEPIKLGEVDVYLEEAPGAETTFLSENVFLDSIEVDSGSPSAPDTPVELGRTDSGDDPFIDVDIFI